MNRLESMQNGGIPFEWDDLRWESNAVREAFKHLSKGLGIANNDNYIIWGCDSNGSGGLNAGAVCINGEPCTFDALASLPSPSPDLYFEIQESNDPTGSEVMQNGAVVEQYKVRKAVVISGAAGSNPKVGSKVLQSLINGMNDVAVQGTVVFADISMPVSGSVIPGSVSGYVRRQKVGKRVFIAFWFTMEIGAPSLIFNVSLANILGSDTVPVTATAIIEAHSNNGSIPAFLEIAGPPFGPGLAITKNWGGNPSTDAFGAGIWTFKGNFNFEIN